MSTIQQLKAKVEYLEDKLAVPDIEPAVIRAVIAEITATLAELNPPE